MALSSSVSGLWLFGGSLEDEANGNTLVSSVNPTYVQFQRYNLSTGTTDNETGLLFEENIPLRASGVSISSGGVKQFSISFWWYSPSAVGYTRHAITRNLTSKVVPIIAQAESYTFGDEELISDGTGEFIISEVAASQTQNAIKLEICSGNNNPTHSYLSDAYDPGLRHIFISYTTVSDSGGDVSLIKIYIDGKITLEHQGPLVDVGDTGSNLYLNKVYHGYTAHKYFQSGSYISELVILSADDSNNNFARKVFEWGYNAITDSDEIDKLYSYFGFSFEQPSTITTNQIYSEGGNIYVSRSNGDILKGFRPIWDTEFTYKTQENVDDLTSDKPNNVVKLSSGAGITITGTTVRI